MRDSLRELTTTSGQGFNGLTISDITEDRVSGNLKVDSDLVLATGDGAAEKQRDSVFAAQGGKESSRMFSVFFICTGQTMSFGSRLIQLGRNRSVDFKLHFPGNSFDDSEIAFFDPILFK